MSYLIYSNFGLSSAPPSPFATIMGSLNDTTDTWRYTFADDSVGVGTSMSSSVKRGAATSNTSVALITTGAPAGGTGGTLRYTYSNNSVAAGASIGEATQSLSAIGNSTMGIYTGGYWYSDASQVRTKKYTYSSDVFATSTSTSSPTTFEMVGTVGYSVFGLICRVAISSTTTTDKFTYSTEAITSGTAFNYAAFGLVGFGNSTIGIMSGGESPVIATTSKYTYSTNGVVTATNLNTARCVHGTSGNSIVGVALGGYNSSFGAIGTSEKYTYSADTCVAGGSIPSSGTITYGVGFSEYQFGLV